MARSKRTILDRREMGTLLATGASRADIAEYQRDGYSFEEILEFCETSKAVRDAGKDEDADRSAKATKRAMKPENEFHPAKSAFSYPEGDVARPRLEPPYPITYAGHPVELDVTTAQELELLYQIDTPGKYVVTKSDDSPVEIDIEIQRNYKREITKLDIIIPARGKHNWPSQVKVLEMILAQQADKKASPLVAAHG